MSEILGCMGSRGRDSSGFAVYGAEAAPGCLRWTFYQPDADYSWKGLLADLGEHFPVVSLLAAEGTHAVIDLQGAEKSVRSFLARKHPLLNIRSVGRSIQIIKDVGGPADVIERFSLRSCAGSHAIGHTRMATESAVTSSGSHPFSSGQDLCLVHNGSLSNHNSWRRRLQGDGIGFETENDSEVAAGYLRWRIQQGATLEESLEHAIEDLDGFYTFAVGTRDGFAVLRDPIACKPAVMAETDDYVALGSEYRALASLPGIDEARLWEPEPATVYTWSVSHVA